MKIRQSTLTLSFIALTATSLVAEASCCCCLSPQPRPGSVYINVEGGASFSRTAQINPPSPPWDPSPSGYDSRLGTSEVLGAGVGYIINPLFHLELTADHRNSFNYQKFQVSSAPLGSKTRYFDLKNTTVMANLFIDGSGLSFPCRGLVINGPGFAINPFINGGIGVAFNKVDNFHSIQAQTGTAFTLMNSNTQSSFAYQFGAGLDIKTCKRISLGVGYRYVDGGRFSSNNYLLDNPDTGAISGESVPAWKSRLKTNEVYADLHYNFG